MSWITVLDSVPELELVTFLPEFLDGLLSVTSLSFLIIKRGLIGRWLGS